MPKGNPGLRRYWCDACGKPMQAKDVAVVLADGSCLCGDCVEK